MPRVWQWANAHATLTGVVLIVTSVLFACTLAEAITRIVMATRGHYPHKDPILHHSLKPHAQMKRVESEFQVVYRINRHGLRDEEIRLPKPPQVFRILMVGDSFTFGVGVELHATFTKQLGDRVSYPHPPSSRRLPSPSQDSSALSSPSVSAPLPLPHHHCAFLRL